MFPFADTIPTKRWAVVTYILVALNVVSLLWFMSLPPQQQEMVTAQWGFVPARVAQVSDPHKIVDVQIGQQQFLWWGQIVGVPRVVQLRAQPQQIMLSAVTCMFLHGGWLHLIGNMIYLLLFGDNIEDKLGHALYAVFYFVGGLSATAAHWAMDPSSATPIIGASGAIAAVLGGYAVTYPHARIKTLVILFLFVTVIELPAYVFLIFWFGMQLFSGLGALGGQMAGGVAWWAHVGGFIVGAVMMPLFSLAAPQEPPEVLDADEDWNRRHGFGLESPDVSRRRPDSYDPRWPEGWD
ncbi:MAG TPA: rhomboid family intramembrane serine protease [Pirellulales bacterium]|nr:rhomboid family intramembrane serine protease [Pirellulales bacterium]